MVGEKIMQRDRNRSSFLKLAILWLTILLISSFWLSVRGTSDPVVMTVLPQVPHENEPIIVTFRLNNPSPEPSVTQFRFYSNGELLLEGDAAIAPNSSKAYKYVYENALPMGSQLNFVVQTESNQGHYEKMLSTPPYPPQLWSSFVSFASFSTSVMSSMSTMVFYQDSFTDISLNIGIIISLVLIMLLIFMEFPIASSRGRSVATMGRLRIRLSTIWILLIIFVSMVYTKVVMILIG